MASTACPAQRPGCAGRDEGDVDVGMERHLAAAVAADGEQKQPVGAVRAAASAASAWS